MAGRSSQPRRNARIAELVERIGPPISSVGWSPQFVAQTLEVLPVATSEGQLIWLKPIHADSLRVGLAPSAKPAETVLEVLGWYPLAPLIVHSTSWRHEEGRIVLTYVAVVTVPASLPPDSLVTMPVRRVDLARGGATSAPESIGFEAVLEHALRHLSWLVRDDPAVTRALAGWQEVLAGFEPEPFRSLA
ncbi:MAG: hypothetical protein E6I17_06235 [Chloroflexi bacterium]|nr:MAG: hypothetical protein E6I17_06235 [Chloroflexota bacterium]